MADLVNVLLTLAEFNPDDDESAVGGFHTLLEITTEVNSVFQPGFVPPTDFPTTVIDQYRKVYWRNERGNTLAGVKVYGFNVKNNNIVKFALEKDIGGTVIIQGSETIKDYLTAPGLFSDYAFTEVQSDDALLIGNTGVLGTSQGQGIWFRQKIDKNESDDASDNFRLGVNFDL